MSLNKSLNGPDMGPGALTGEEISEQDLATVIINRSNQGPFFLRATGPSVG
jgi:hypothetical protein